MSQGGTTNTGIALPITPTQGGTGLTSPGTAGNILNSTGTAWQSVTPLNATPNYGMSYIISRGIF